MFEIVRQREIEELLAKHDRLRHGVGETETLDTEPLNSALVAYFAGKETTASVLGIDIYRYSQYCNEAQRLIPALFESLYDTARGSCLTLEKFLFQQEQFSERFIPTGDGGFQIFTTPLHGLVFAAYFQMILYAYNSHLMWPR